jgi:hypothetical protein
MLLHPSLQPVVVEIIDSRNQTLSSSITATANLQNRGNQTAINSIIETFSSANRWLPCAGFLVISHLHYPDKMLKLLSRQSYARALSQRANGRP